MIEINNIKRDKYHVFIYFYFVLV